MDSLKDWKPIEFETYTELTKFISGIKNKLVGQKLDEIWIMGINYNEDWIEWDKNKTENVVFEVDEPVVLFIGDTRLEVEYTTPSTVKINQNSLTLNEKSYQRGKNIWRNINSYYSKNIIGHILKDIVVQQRFMPPTIEDPDLEYDRTDLYGAIGFIMDNGYCLRINADLDYMQIDELPNAMELEKPFEHNTKLVYAKDEELLDKIKQTENKHTCPKCGSKNIAEYLYGMPVWGKELEIKQMLGQIIIGGCCPEDGSPEFHCNSCGHDFGEFHWFKE